MPLSSFVLNDETVINSYGFVVRNAGGKFERFNANPVMLNHHDGKDVPGRWQNLRVEGSKLNADPVFDEDDPDAVKLKGKVKRNFIKGASIGIIPLNAELLEVPGKGLVPCLTEWELLEASITPVPSNTGCMKFYSKEGKLLSDSEIKMSINELVKPQKNMDKIILTAEAAKVLGLPKESGMTELNAAIMELSAKNAQLKIDKEKAEIDLKNIHTLKAKELLDLAISEGRITAEKRESFEKLAVSDYKQAKDLLDAMPKRKTFSTEIRNNDHTPTDREGWDYMKWLKEDSKGLSAMETNDPDGFAKLKADYKSKYN